MSTCEIILRDMGPGEVTTFEVQQGCPLMHRQVIVGMGWLVRRGEIEHVRDELCDPSLGSYWVGVYRRRGQ